MNFDTLSLKGVRVIALDDDEKFLKIIVAALRASGAEVYYETSGRSGLQLLYDHAADVLLVDLNMPDLDGVAFLQEALNIWPWSGVVVMTGYDVDARQEELDALGVKRIIRKPFPFAVVLEELHEEYRARRQVADQEQAISVFRFQQQLQLLRQCTEPALHAESLVEAMRSLTLELGQALDFPVIGISGLGNNENAAIFNLREPVTQQFLGELKMYMAERYMALTGDDATMDLAIELQGEEPSPDGEDHPDTCFCVPIMSGGEVLGFLILAGSSSHRVADAEIAFIYNIANHLSAVFTALNRMRGLAIRDALTGLYSRLHLESELARLWSNSARYGRALSIVIMDFDHFKMINDTYGHQVGDRVLVEFGQLLEAAGRTSDVVGRYGGEEFLVLLPDCGQHDVRGYCSRFLDAVREHVFVEGDLDLHLTVSIGASSADITKLQESTVDELLAEADQALYLAKHAGRNCARVWTRLAASKAAAEEELQKTFTGEETLIMRPLRRGTVLVVDDEPQVRMVLAELLRLENYDVADASSGERALALIKQEPERFDVVMTDVQMPGMTGLELIKRLKELDETIICIVVSAYASSENTIEAIRCGAFDFIRKPHIAYEDVIPTVNNAVEYRKTLLENRQYQRHLSEMVRQKSGKAREALRSVRQSYEFTLEAMVALLDAREKDTGDHSKRVRALVMRLAREMGWPEEREQDLNHGALLHDIGKIAIPDRILLKPGKHTDEEREIMKQHAEVGYQVLSGSPYLEGAAEIVYSHQEHWDGSGYPRGLKGEAIPAGARIFSVIDAYDAMRSKRVYRDALPEQVVFDHLVSQAGKQFDPEVIEAFKACREDIDRMYQAWDGEEDEDLMNAVPERGIDN